MKTIGILGGTFDPIHYGHLRLGLELCQQFNLQEVRFIPCQKPVLDKKAQATATQRLAMLKLAIANQTKFKIDARELQRLTPSFTVETLQAIRAEVGNVPLAFILGYDSFLSLPRWHRWQELTQLAHLIVVPRPGTTNLELLPDFIDKNQVTKEYEPLKTSPAGGIFFAEITPLAISSTAIREQLQAGLNPRYLLPESVLEFIKKHHLYIRRNHP